MENSPEKNPFKISSNKAESTVKGQGGKEIGTSQSKMKEGDRLEEEEKKGKSLNVKNGEAGRGSSGLLLLAHSGSKLVSFADTRNRARFEIRKTKKTANCNLYYNIDCF